MEKADISTLEEADISILVLHSELTDHPLSAIEIEIGGQQLKINYDVKVQGDRFAGTVAVEGADLEGEIKATRRREWSEPIELFAGNDLSKWDFQRVGGENQWKVVDGVMVNATGGWNIFTKQKFKDYKLRIDVKVPPSGNSGIYLSGRYEIQVADSYGRGVNKGGMNGPRSGTVTCPDTVPPRLQLARSTANIQQHFDPFILLPFLRSSAPAFELRPAPADDPDNACHRS